eukprot:gene29620-36696_t
MLFRQNGATRCGLCTQSQQDKQPPATAQNDAPLPSKGAAKKLPWRRCSVLAYLAYCLRRHA